MTNKQIIDVSKCKYYKELSNPNEDGDEYNDICECCITESAFCFDECNSKCYFKNWQRKEQRIVELNKTIQVKEQECEELKEKINSLVCSENCYKFKQAEKLKQTLTEVKEISENAKTKVFVDMEKFWEQILQKISEVEQ